MPAGIEVINDNGSIQIDQNYSNYLLKAKGIATTSAIAPQIHIADISVSNSEAPILCVRPTAGLTAVNLITQHNPGGVTTFRLVTHSVASVEWFIFDAGRAVADISPGLSVYLPDGSLAYNSNAAALKVESVILSPPIASGESWTNSRYYDLGSTNPAICVSNPKVYMQPTGEQQLFLLTHDGFRVSGRTLEIRPIVIQSIPSSNPVPGPVHNSMTTVLVVDVSAL